MAERRVGILGSGDVAKAFGRGIHITEERVDEPAFRGAHPEARIGGGSGPNYRGEPGYDFFNSPSFVQNVDVAGRPTAMTSTNGGNAVTDLRLAGGDDVTVYVGGLTNGVALAEHLREQSEPTYFVAAGSSGKPSPEDVTGALYIARHLFGDQPTGPGAAAYKARIAQEIQSAPTVDTRVFLWSSMRLRADQAYHDVAQFHLSELWPILFFSIDSSVLPVFEGSPSVNHNLLSSVVRIVNATRHELEGPKEALATNAVPFVHQSIDQRMCFR